jgi:hypothetical protein
VTGRFLSGNKAQFLHGGYSKISKNIPLTVRRQVQAIREQLIRDIIGSVEPALTAAQTILIDKTVNLYQVTLCLEAYIRREGPFRGKKLDPVLGQNYLAYVNTIRLNLRELGISRKAGDVILSPLQLAEQIDKEQAEQEAQEAEKRAEKPQDERISRVRRSTSVLISSLPEPRRPGPRSRPRASPGPPLNRRVLSTSRRPFLGCRETPPAGREGRRPLSYSCS